MFLAVACGTIISWAHASTELLAAGSGERTTAVTSSARRFGAGRSLDGRLRQISPQHAADTGGTQAR